MDATPFLPERVNLTSLRAAAADCRGCDLYAPATQTVSGEGRKAARLMRATWRCVYSTESVDIVT